MSENKFKKSKYVFVTALENKEKVSDFFTDLFSISYIYEVNNTFVYKLVSDENYMLEDIFDSLLVDFGFNISLFETNYVQKESDVYQLLDIYNRFNKRSYANISSLIMDLMKEDQKALFTIRNIVMYQIDKDSDLKNIILAMYKNDLNVSKTASSVYMHRNTVINKLDLIKKTSGMDVQKFYDAIALYNLMYLK